jgi:ADP-ribose pyrophosphatase
MDIQRPISKQPLPAYAKKVFEGVIFDTYQWEQKMFDGTVSIFEKIKRPDTVVVFAVLDNGKIILTKEEQPGKEPFIGVPGGRVNEGEEILTAAKRELLEETGCEASDFMLWKSLQPVSKIEWALYVFIARGARKKEDLNLDSGEKIETMEVDFDEFLNIAIQEGFDEPEIYKEVVDALSDKNKKEKLRKFLFGK